MLRRISQFAYSEFEIKQKLYLAEKRNQESIMFFPDGMLIFDDSYKIILVNSAFKTLWGLEKTSDSDLESYLAGFHIHGMSFYDYLKVER